MTTDDGFIGALEDYLESFDGVTPLPGRVRDAVGAELPSTRQVDPWLGPVRSTEMSTTSTIVRLGVLAACLVVAAIFASAILLPGGSDHAVGAPTTVPTAAPTAEPSPTPVASPLPLALATTGRCGSASTSHVGCVPAGTYPLGPAVPGGRIDVPAGWFEWDPGQGSVGLLVDRADTEASGWGVVFSEVGDVARDPCHEAAGTYPAAQMDTPEKFAAALAAWPGFHATAPEDITIGGIAGVRVRLTWPKDPSACAIPTFWQTPAGTPIDGYPVVNGGSTRQDSAYPADYSVIKVDGRLIAIRTMASARTSPNERGLGLVEDPTRHEADLVALQTMLDSIRFESPAP